MACCTAGGGASKEAVAWVEVHDSAGDRVWTVAMGDEHEHGLPGSVLSRLNSSAESLEGTPRASPVSMDTTPRSNSTVSSLSVSPLSTPRGTARAGPTACPASERSAWTASEKSAWSVSEKSGATVGSERRGLTREEL